MPPSTYDAIPDFGRLYDAVPLYAARADVGFYKEEALRAKGPVLELMHLLARAGLRAAAIHGNYDRSPLADASPDIIVVAERAT